MTNPEHIEQLAFWEDIDPVELSDEHFDQYQTFCALLNSEFATQLEWEYNEANECWLDKDHNEISQPDFLHDLNLCQYFYDDLRGDEEIEYANILTGILNGGMLVPGIGFQPCPVIFATPWQKCLAFAILRNI
jgi:hypothetical protein